mgnify:CR=1 FL=1
MDNFHETIVRAFDRPDTSAQEGWEPMDATRRRVVDEVRPLLTTCVDGDVVLVGHGTAWTLLVAELTGSAPDLDRWRALAMPDVITLDMTPARLVR